MPGFPPGIEVTAVNWTNVTETSMSKETSVRKSVTVGDKEEASWHPRAMWRANGGWASEEGNESREIKQWIVQGCIRVQWDFFFFLTDNEKPLLVLCRKEKQFISSMLCVVAVYRPHWTAGRPKCQYNVRSGRRSKEQKSRSKRHLLFLKDFLNDFTEV